MTPCPITADRDEFRGAVTEREAALAEALERLQEVVYYHVDPSQVREELEPAVFAAFAAHNARLDARAHTATAAGGK